MKTSKKSLLGVALLLCIAGGSFAAYGAIFATSNVEHVVMNYSVALTSSVADSIVTLTATVTNVGGGSPVGSGIVVDFYYSTNNADFYYFASQTTDISGVAQTEYEAAVNGEFYFKAIANIP